MFLAKTPSIIKKYYPSLVWSIVNDEKKIYLTFDDGPIPGVTEWVLDLLKQHKVKATFFCIGDNVEKHPAVYQRILDEGHAVGNHTFNHVNGWKTSRKAYVGNVARCAEVVDSNIFRPPYGRIKKTQLRMLLKDYKVVMWDVLSGDFDQKVSPEKCYNNVVKHIRSGSIIVFHDSLKAERNLKHALPKVIEYALKEGFTLDALR